MEIFLFERKMLTVDPNLLLCVLDKVLDGGTSVCGRCFATQTNDDGR